MLSLSFSPPSVLWKGKLHNASYRTRTKIERKQSEGDGEREGLPTPSIDLPEVWERGRVEGVGNLGIPMEGEGGATNREKEERGKREGMEREEREGEEREQNER